MKSHRRVQAVGLSVCAAFTVGGMAALAGTVSTLAAAQGQIIAVDDSVKVGDKITLKLKTPAETACHIEVQDASFTDVLHLLPQVSDKDGNATWVWTVPKDYQAQVMPVILTMRYKDHDEKLVTSIKIGGLKADRPALSVAALPEKVNAGDSIAVNIKTDPEAKCEIKVQGAALTEMTALGGQTADQNGVARWTFHVPKDYRADKLPIIITSQTKTGESKFVSAIEVDKLTASK